ncbi:hypothetical protein DOY81_009817 [Sarcophaga bullata]|nr:hypothetical protein DOY81_009817 [Sarcophaga bullata]
MCLKPPLCATKSDVDFAISVLDTIFGEHYLKEPRSWRQYDLK